MYLTSKLAPGRMAGLLHRGTWSVYHGGSSVSCLCVWVLMGSMLCLPASTDASNTTTVNTTASATTAMTTSATITTATDIIPKVIIAIAVIAFAAGIGVGVAKLLDYIYDHSRLNDNASDMSDHTKEMLKAQMILMKMKSKKKKPGDEEQGEGEAKKPSKLKSLVQRVASARPRSKEGGSDKDLDKKDNDEEKGASGDPTDSPKNESETKKKDGAKIDVAKTETETGNSADVKASDKGETPADSDVKLKKVDSKEVLHTGHGPVTRTTSDVLGSVGGPTVKVVTDQPKPGVAKPGDTKPGDTKPSETKPGASNSPAAPNATRAQSSKGSPRRDSSPGGKHLAGQLPSGKK